MDPHRVNEFGTSADDQQQPVGGGADQQPAIEGRATTEDDIVEPSQSSEVDSEPSVDGNSETDQLRRRLHKRED